MWLTRTVDAFLDWAFSLGPAERYLIFGLIFIGSLFGAYLSQEAPPSFKFLFIATLCLLVVVAFTVFVMEWQKPAGKSNTPIRSQLEARIWNAIAAENLSVPSADLRTLILDVGEQIFALELFQRPDHMNYVIDGTNEAAVKLRRLLEDDWLRREEYVLEAISQSLIAFLRRLPAQETSALSIPFSETINASAVIYEMIEPFRAIKLKELLLAQHIPKAFHDASVRVTGQNPKWKGPGLLYPQHYKGPDVVGKYLAGSPLQRLFQIPVPVVLENRFEHTWLMANSGHGKTQLIQHLIAHDLDSETSVIVIDSQQHLIDNIASLKDLRDFILIDPTIAVPAINLFALGENLELYRFMFASLLESPMTDNQATLFDNAALLLQKVPDATFMDFYRLLDGEDYSEYYSQLDDIGRRFFQRDFNTKGADGYEGTKKQIVRRLNTILRKPPFTEMFSQAESKIDIGNAMDEGKVILINTSAEKLGAEGSKLFGRFMLALIAGATAQRASNSSPRPVYCYIDEADQYAKDDPTITNLLARARKNRVGLVLAHRWPEEMGTTIHALESTCATIFAGGLRASDLAYMSKVMDCHPSLLQGNKGRFALYRRGHGIVSVEIKFGASLEAMPKLKREELELRKLEQAKEYGATPRQSQEAPPRKADRFQGD